MYTMSETLVLSVGFDALVLSARERVLRTAGYFVVSAASIKGAFHLFQEGDFDLMVMCNTIPARDRERLTCLIRVSGSRIPIASISSTKTEKMVFPEATVEENSVEFLAGIKRLMAKRFELASIGSLAARCEPARSEPTQADQWHVSAPAALRMRPSENRIQ
jgi:CheY-like chemotaxis protein